VTGPGGKKLGTKLQKGNVKKRGGFFRKGQMRRKKLSRKKIKKGEEIRVKKRGMSGNWSWDYGGELGPVVERKTACPSDAQASDWRTQVRHKGVTWGRSWDKSPAIGGGGRREDTRKSLGFIFGIRGGAGGGKKTLVWGVGITTNTAERRTYRGGGKSDMGSASKLGRARLWVCMNVRKKDAERRKKNTRVSTRGEGYEGKRQSENYCAGTTKAQTTREICGGDLWRTQAGKNLEKKMVDEKGPGGGGGRYQGN